ncbi:MAG: GDP-mannose 4,6-dehydratase [Thermoprotei archaeon]
MRILVTGGAGFIGSHVAEYYARNDNEVIIFDNLLRNEILGKKIGDPFYNWNYLKQYKNIKLIKGDIRNFDEVKAISNNVNAIIHTAAQVAVTTSITDPRTDFEINALGTFNILEAARLNDASLVFISTNKVYGENVNKIPLIERDTRYEFADPNYKSGIPETFPIDLTQHSPYGCSKLAADIYVQDYAHTYGLKTGILRLSCCYGERQFGVEDQGFLAHFVISTVLDKKITIYGTGKQVRDVLHVEDLVKAIDLILKKAKASPGDVYNIGGGANNAISLLEVIKYIERISGKKIQLEFDKWRKADQKVYISDIRKAEEKLGWRPKISWEEGIARLYNWVSNHRQLFTES